jgi:hypothetical protein
MKYTHVLAIDPGLRSGYAQWSKGEFKAGIADPQDMCIIIEQWANQHPGRQSLIVSESFHITEETGRKDQTGMHWPLELKGVARYLAFRADIAFDTQSPAQMKSFTYSDEANPYAKLKHYGFYTPGREAHARDAAGHLLLALLSRGIQPCPSM